MAEQRGFALVTGAGSGIGRSASLALARDGWAVALVGRRRAMLEETASLAGQARTLIAPADLADPAQIEAAFATVRQEFGRLDLLFNNAGMNVPGVALEDLPVEKWKAVVDVNLTACFLCTQQAFRIMKAQTPQGGRIINNGSISAHAPRPDSIAYTATKHAVTGLTRTTALDGRKYDIACGQIDVGNAHTAMGGRMAGGVKQADGHFAEEPTMDVEHCGRMVAHMASLPKEANILTVTIMATKMPFVGRG
ncbi:MAG: SDR family oxidoreductase [Acetobacteraceae bacterium]|nr:SDR family oxidoreductase [Acetobacteraceae bacterium]